MGPNHYRLSITLSLKQYDKLKQAQALMAATKRGTDPAELFDQALDVLIERQLKRKYGIDHSPRPAKTASSQSTTGEKSDSPFPGESYTIKQALPGEIVNPPEKQADNTTDGDKGAPAKNKSRYIPLQVRRNVYKRDGGQCSYVDAMGQRCDSTYALHFHHRKPFAKGGKHTEANLELRCPAHNDLAARQDFGSTFMQHCVTEKNGIQGPFS
jgi:5-methylcytosine-specific restriction endonuclease McrA